MLVNWAYRGDYTYAAIYKGHQIRPSARSSSSSPEQ